MKGSKLGWWRTFCSGVGVFAACIATVSASPPSAHPNIVVGPDILVSTDTSYAHAEISLSADPADPNFLIGSAIVEGRGDGSDANRLYISRDGGNTWTMRMLASQEQNGGGDPWMAFGASHRAYYTGIIDSATHAWVEFSDSADGGMHWSQPRKLKIVDRPEIGVDLTSSRYTGRIYLAGMYSDPHVKNGQYVVGVMVSSDGGRTFSSPFNAAYGHGVDNKFTRGTGINVLNNILVLHDGTVVLPYTEFSMQPPKGHETVRTRFFTVSSGDGGRTFSKPVLINSIVAHDEKSTLRGYQGGNPGAQPFDGPVAAYYDPRAKRDVMYAAWPDYRFGPERIVFSQSFDRGKGWSSPIQVSPENDSQSLQYQPRLAVNAAGIVGVAWLDTRTQHIPGAFQVYFTASLDGGRSFLPAARISAETSLTNTSINMRPYPYAGIHAAKDGVTLSIASAASRLQQGGDYSSMAASSDGSFHPMWADGSNGAFQLHSARIIVQRFAPSHNDLPADAVERALNERLQIVMDPNTSYDPAQKIYTIPVRLRNVSAQTIYAPVRVTVLKLSNNSDTYSAIPALAFLNSGNGKTGVGASYDYTRAIGDAGLLPPGGVSSAISWKIKVSNPYEPIYNMKFRLSGIAR